eukprot:Clim_evm6s105 gene=Clim_evmTU6s105
MSSISFSYLAVKLGVIVSSFVVAGLLLSSDLWEYKKDFTTAQQAGSGGLAIVSVLGGCVSALLAIAYLITAKQDSGSSKVLGANVGLGALFTLLSFVFAICYVAIYSSDKMVVGASIGPNGGSSGGSNIGPLPTNDLAEDTLPTEPATFTYATIFSSEFPSH